MKNTLIAMTILFAFVAHAGEITVEQYKEMYEIHKEAYETIKPGMTIEFQKVMKDQDEAGSEQICRRYYKEVVVTVVPGFKYLVYQKRVAQNDCRAWQEKAGATDESLTWREIGRSDDWRGTEDFNYTKISATGTIVKMEAYRVNEEGEKFTYKTERDLSKSQFNNLIMTNYSNKTIRHLIKLSETDVNTIKTQNLEVYDETEY